MNMTKEQNHLPIKTHTYVVHNQVHVTVNFIVIQNSLQRRPVISDYSNAQLRVA